MGKDDTKPNSNMNSEDLDAVKKAFEPKPKGDSAHASAVPGEDVYHSVLRLAREAADAAKAAGEAAKAADLAHRNTKTASSPEALTMALTAWKTQVSLACTSADASGKAAEEAVAKAKSVSKAEEAVNAGITAERAQQEAEIAKLDAERVLATAAATAQGIVQSAAGPKR
ncbi:hypothetical protein [Variovorax sp. GT1P44]|uniref:hypothetical protein n=1 Tax=Variovorax sp. GT1P44 TaxID=3443742 RepID=UPI003F46D25A